jgi:hypothetical protein
MAADWQRPHPDPLSWSIPLVANYTEIMTNAQTLSSAPYADVVRSGDGVPFAVAMSVGPIQPAGTELRYTPMGVPTYDPITQLGSPEFYRMGGPTYMQVGTNPVYCRTWYQTWEGPIFWIDFGNQFDYFDDEEWQQVD